MKKLTSAGSQAYTPLTLKLYDWWVLGISNKYAWKCSTKEKLIPHFTKHAGMEHLDIGVGTGFYLPHLPSTTNISLMDLNPSSLAAASRRDSAIKIKECIQHDVFEIIPIKYHAKFDSISMFYLLHCLPGTLKEKERVIVNVANALKPDGTLYGATILGDSAAHSRFGNKLMKIYNSKGIFSNREDSEQDLHSVLSSNFVDVNVVRVGKVVIFSAKGRALKQRLA